MPRLVDPLVLETLTANVAIEQVSFPVAIRSLVRFANTLFGQNYVLPKSLRRKLNQTIMDRRRMKKKSKFSGKQTFIIHPSSRTKDFDENEWLDVEDDSEEDCVDETYDLEICLGYLDAETGEMVQVEEAESDSEVTADVDQGCPDESPPWHGWPSPFKSDKRFIDLDTLVRGLELSLELVNEDEAGGVNKGKQDMGF